MEAGVTFDSYALAQQFYIAYADSNQMRFKFSSRERDRTMEAKCSNAGKAGSKKDVTLLASGKPRNRVSMKCGCKMRVRLPLQWMANTQSSPCIYNTPVDAIRQIPINARRMPNAVGHSRQTS